jgi:hypothetical protein
METSWAVFNKADNLTYMSKTDKIVEMSHLRCLIKVMNMSKWTVEILT